MNGMKALCRKGINFSVSVTEHWNSEAVQSPPLEIFKPTWIRSICSNRGLDWMIPRSLLTPARMWFWDTGELQTWCKHSRAFSGPTILSALASIFWLTKVIRGIHSYYHWLHAIIVATGMSGLFSVSLFNVSSGIGSKQAAGWSRGWATII